MLSGITTQGEGREDKWVKEYEVYYSTDGTNYFPYSQKQDGVPTAFVSNTDSNTPVTVFFIKNIIARFIRIHPVDYHNGIAFR